MIWVNEEGDGWKRNGKVKNNVTVGAHTEAYGEGTLFSFVDSRLQMQCEYWKSEPLSHKFSFCLNGLSVFLRFMFFFFLFNKFQFILVTPCRTPEWLDSQSSCSLDHLRFRPSPLHFYSSARSPLAAALWDLVHHLESKLFQVKDMSHSLLHSQGLSHWELTPIQQE